MEKLKQKRKNLKSSLTRFRTFLSSFDAENGMIEELIERKNKIAGILENFEEIIVGTIALDGDSDELSTEMENFESMYFSELSRAKKIINDRNARVSQSQAGQTINAGNASHQG